MIACHEITRGTAQGPAMLFLHGLDGDPIATWGVAGAGAVFPRRLAAALPAARILSLGYPAALAVYRQRPELSLAIVAEALAERLAPILSHRPALGIVGYCLGGLVAAMALRRLAGTMTLPPTLLCLMDAPLRLPGEEDPFPQVGAALRLSGTELADITDWLHLSYRPGAFEMVSMLSSAPGWLAPYARDALSPPAPLVRLPGDHLALAMAPETGDFAPLRCVIAAWRASGLDPGGRPSRPAAPHLASPTAAQAATAVAGIAPATSAMISKERSRAS
ncbi:hypothetical protein [Sphingomonas abietis]|uniref:Thioesterase domain-containing protein n=1 Tax=Sphingomonas abietis TaxID=3012344 RepID=A0ABY7NIM9_9SPHN|nr:hypothetical protein [Sphingomonas abietis]WBO21385.1 hypothetical protein PBT88_14475 [Sphingomonas abietis]